MIELPLLLKIWFTVKNSWDIAVSELVRILAIVQKVRARQFSVSYLLDEKKREFVVLHLNVLSFAWRRLGWKRREPLFSLNSR